ncbi:pyrimidine dimer DNA glycosylase/endonuclease V [Neiella marina]|uniref:Pyrimidine dimer DNA glycosylase/endonuclease V n=1 Tax=Neiella holothuriorum TaxID=2870530 RepID=A0ABS7EGZ3_9GAMM|nr:pyrimidine dimer DNA glycosylase/endonuclease V [Neiella holothuriorum]MBW8191550.1 pyrimidine dimer DNA glycosylase/endonuclease V [Neiella holothuriorum]
MKIWDCYPAYLTQPLLVAEHREIHGLLQIVERGKSLAKTADPHIANWLAHPGALATRHEQLVEEMSLRDIEHKSPVAVQAGAVLWPKVSGDIGIGIQFEQLAAMGNDARLLSPKKPDDLLQQNALSIMARDPSLYKFLQAENQNGRLKLIELQREVTEVIRRPVNLEFLERVVATMWRYCEQAPEAFTFSSRSKDPMRRLKAIQFLASKYKWPELWQTTALTDLACCQLVE